MTRRVILTAAAVKDLSALDKNTARRITAKLKALANEVDINLPRLKRVGEDFGDVYKLRVGDYRVLLRFEEGDVVVDVIGHRSEIYKVFKRR